MKNTPMLRKLWQWLLSLALFLGSAMGARAQVPSVDTMLEWQDQMVIRSYMANCPQDFRYKDLLARISARFNGHLAAVYRKPDKEAHYFVFVANMGFNAQSWNRVIVFDSLLLDSMRCLAKGIAVHEKLEAPYVQQLAQYVASLNTATKSGFVMPNLQNADNPYSLPNIWGLTPAQRDRSDALFEEMVAGWMAHEGSHVFLNHCRDRIQEQRLIAMYQQGRIPADILQQHMNQYLAYSLTRQKEAEADEKGVRLLVRSGYSVEGLVYTLHFAQLLQDISGSTNDYFRTHPLPQERIDMAERVAEEERARREKSGNP